MMKRESFFLLFIAAGVFPVSLLYGGNPAVSMPNFYDIEVDTVNLSNILRAVMGLYIALCIFWVIGARYEKFRLPALWSLVIFMTGIASGRTLSLVLDGMPSSLFIFYLIVEVIAAIIGFKLISNLQKN